MNLVAFDTSTDSCSVAVQVGDEVLVDHRLVKREHAALLLPMLQGLLSQFELAPSQLEGVVFGRGPGSFTGVRIAAASAQGLAVAADCEVQGISSLHALATGCARVRRDLGQPVDCVMAAIDARMSQIYTNFYRASSVDASSALLELSDERVVDPDACADPIVAGLSDAAAPMRSIVLCGSGAEVYEEKLRAALSAAMPRSIQPAIDTTIELDAGIVPDARDLLALVSSDDSHWTSPEHAQPTYLRNKVALTLIERSSH